MEIGLSNLLKYTHFEDIQKFPYLNIYSMWTWYVNRTRLFQQGKYHLKLITKVTDLRF